MEITIKEILYVVLTVISPLALKLLWQYVNAKVAGSRYADAVNCVFAAVDYVNQVFVDALKQAGSFDDQAQQDAFIKAMDTALELMESNTVSWLENTFDCVDSWLVVQIEAAVKEVKR
jgi:hypothetical protein